MWFHHRRSQTSFKILETNKGNICGRVSFPIVIGEWIGQFEFFQRNATKDVFLIILRNFLNSSFSNIPWKKFLDGFSESNDFIIDLFLTNFQLSQNTQRKHFSGSLYLLNLNILDCRAAVLKTKGQFCKDFV